MSRDWCLIGDPGGQWSGFEQNPHYGNVLPWIKCSHLGFATGYWRIYKEVDLAGPNVSVTGYADPG
jgi:hypothetical protein